MFATSNHVHNGHNSHYNPHLPQIPNGHVQHQSRNPNNIPNGSVQHQQHQQQPPPPPQQPQAPQAHSHKSQQPKERITVVGVPSVSIHNGRLVVGESDSFSQRSYTPLKVLGDGSFGTVWLCDWHGTLPPNTPLSPMQCGAGAKPEWAGKRLVAVKRMKKRWEGGWDECKKLKELESLRAIAFHPNIIPLYDFFLLPQSKELYFVFESMEGNLYHLIKARKGRPLAGGLVSSIFRQIVSGLHHIHESGYFHRDMKPENVLVTTTGIFDYQSVSPIAPPDAPPEKDVVAIIKLADFGLARETASTPPYTEYVSTRWYRAPEVLLLSRDYSNPVDMWALGTIMAELVNLRPMFPGSTQVDQIARICEVLGDPTDEYGVDARGMSLGGGKWSRGIKMAKAVGFVFSKIQPRDIPSMFDRSVHPRLVECISDLLKYDPDKRLTSLQCLEHPYLLETTPRNNIPLPPGVPGSPPLPPRQPPRNGLTVSLPSNNSSSSTVSNRHPNIQHTHHSGRSNLSIPFASPSNSSSDLVPPVPPIPDASASHRSSFYPSPSSLASPHSHDPRGYEHLSPHHPPMPVWNGNGADEDHMDVYDSHGQPMDVHHSPITGEYPARPHIIEPGMSSDSIPSGSDPSHSQSKLGKLGGLSFGGKKPSKWGLGGMFGHGDKSAQQSANSVPPLDESTLVNQATSLKRTQSSSSNISDRSHPNPPLQVKVSDPKLIKKEAEKMQKEAELQRRALAEKSQRDQARAVMQKRNEMLRKSSKAPDLEWETNHYSSTTPERRPPSKKKPISSGGPIRQKSSGGLAPGTMQAATGRFTNYPPRVDGAVNGDWRSSKARRREFDDDHSMSSSDLQSVSRMSFASDNSDPTPNRLRNRPSLFGISRMTSTSSLRTSFDDFPVSARSSNSFSMEQQLVNDFHLRASVNHPPLSGSVSPPPMQLLSLSPSPTWLQMQQSKDQTGLHSRGGLHPNFVSMSPPHTQHQAQMSPSGLSPPFEFGMGNAHSLPPSPYGHPPSSGSSPHSAINPIFKVPPFTPSNDDRTPAGPLLPPFSHLEAVAEGEYPTSLNPTPKVS